MIIYQKKNENKFYFFMSYNESIISYNILKFIINIYTCQEDEIDDIIINYVNELFNKINDDIELKFEVPQFLDEYKSSIKFNNDILYLEIFQVISIIIEIKDIEWLFKNIFTNIIWVNFSKSKQTSLKRSLCIFYSGLLADLYIKKDIKDNNNTNNILDNENFKKLFGWIFSIYNPPKENEHLLSFYDKLCALCWVAESPLMNISNKVPDKIKEIMIKLINNHSENLFPTDFLNKLTKLQIIE